MQTVRVKVLSLATAAIVISLLVRGCGCREIPVGGVDCEFRGSECVIGAYCSKNMCVCRPNLIALFDSTTCVNITSEKQHTQYACQDNDNCTHVQGTTFCIAKGDRGVCACDQQNRAAPGNLSTCLLGCQQDDDCSQSQINSSLTQGRNVSDKSDLQACVASGRETNFKYCGTDEPAEDNGVDSPEDKEKELLLSLLLVVAIGVMSGGSLVTAIAVFLFLKGICSGEIGAARGHTKGIPAVREKLKLVPVLPPRQTYFGRRISRLYAQRPPVVSTKPPEPPSTRPSAVSMTPQPPASNQKLKQTSMSGSDYASSVVESISESYASSVASSSVASSSVVSSSVVSSSVVSKPETSFDSSVSQRKT